MVKQFLFLIGFLFSFTTLYSQIKINEVLSTNRIGITDEDNNHVDWFELYNNSNSTINLEGYSISDKNEVSQSWVFPAYEMRPHSYLLVFASGKDRKNISLKYQTIIDLGDQWSYAIPPSNTIGNQWRKKGYNDSSWKKGPSGFGYGDGDDNTIIQPLTSIYIRKTFNVENRSNVKSIIFHVDYDDAFIAFINGHVIAMENINLPEKNNFENVQVTNGNEAKIYQGDYPVKYEILPEIVSLLEGENVIAIQGYNLNAASTDFSLIPFLTIGNSDYTYNKLSQYIKPIGEAGLHTNFSINKEGESLYLFNNRKELIDSINVVPLTDDVSYGRFPDGSNTLKYFKTPTPGKTNTKPSNENRIDSIFFSVASGFYKQTVHLNLSTQQSDVYIRYTTDGSEPTINSKAYSSSITINKTSTLRAATFLNEEINSEVFTSSYILYASHNLPVISISSNPKNFFDYYEGILVEGPNAEYNDPRYGANYWMNWEKPINLEYFDWDGKQQINQKAGIRIFGGWSRMNPQKSMAVFARNIYGNNRFEYPFFQDRETDEYKSFLLRNSGNDWSYTMLRDGYVSEVIKTLDIDRMAFQPTVVYLNGEYWGILNMREKPNEHYMANNHGVDPNEVNRIEGNSWLIQGTTNRYKQLISFIENKELKKEADYQWASNEIDVSCFIDYELTEIYINNRDWPGNNIKFWNTNDVNSKWRWIIYDTDFGLGIYNTDDYTQNGIKFATEAYNNDWPNPQWSTLLLRRMLSNQEFKVQFINRMADLMNTVFDPTFMNSKLDSLSSVIDSEIGDHQTKWRRNYEQWEQNVNKIPYFIKNRPRYVREHFRQYFKLSNNYNVHLRVSNQNHGQIKISTITPKNYPFIGSYFSDVPIHIIALPKPGYKFVKWEQDNNSTNNELILTLTGTTKLHAVFEPDYSTEKSVKINEINCFSDKDLNTGDWIELHNTGNNTVSLAGWKLYDSNKASAFIFGSDACIYPNDYLVVYGNKYQFKSIHPKLTNAIGQFKFGLNNNGEVIVLEDYEENIIDYVSYKATLPWPIQPLTSAATLELIDPKTDGNKGENWQTGPNGGTPGRANSSITSASKLPILTHQASCFPTRFSDFTTLRFYSEGNDEFSISIFDLQGRLKKTVSGNINEQGTHYIDIFIEQNHYQSGIYFIKLQTKFGVETLKVIKN